MRLKNYTKVKFFYLSKGHVCYNRMRMEENMGVFKLAIDGPAGSGKSTISAKVADKLGWTHIDTGAMYRAVTLQALRLKIDLNDENAYRFLEDTKIIYDRNKIFLNAEDVTYEIRSDEVNASVSLVSSFPYVRMRLVELQRKAFTSNVVMDGRDIGTTVLPGADLKIFLTADVEERTKRRFNEELKKGKNPTIYNVEKDLLSRDLKDSSRKESPLMIAKDAIILDTTYLTIDEVVKKIIGLIEQEEKRK